MMNQQLVALVLMYLFRCIVTGLAVAGAIYLASEGKEGWGWMVFLAICISPGSIKYDEDKNERT
jgi:hypothetical protein